MFALLFLVVQMATHPVTELNELSVIQQEPARSARVEEWLKKPTPIPLSPDERRQVDSVKTSYDQTWRHMLDDLKKDGDRVAFTMKAMQWDRSFPKSIQKILAPQNRRMFDANFFASEGRQP